MKVENALGGPGKGPACRRFAEAVGNRELDRATRCFARNGCLITADRTAIYGRDRIRPLLAQMIDRRTVIAIETSAVLVTGDLALAAERWSISCDGAGDQRFTLESRPLLVLRRRGTEWKLEIAALWGWAWPASRVPLRFRDERRGRSEAPLPAASTRGVGGGDRILDAAEASFFERDSGEITLAEVAESSGVSVQTVLRRFGSREGLMMAALARVAAKVSLQRGAATPGDPASAVAVLVDHYEELGDRVIRLLGETPRSKVARQLTKMGFAYHAEWCKRVFAPTLDQLQGEELARRTAQLVAVTDVYVWKLLRRDQGLSREHTERAMVGLIEPLTGERAEPAVG
jgi:AcrR family transcriptional regulator/ketosteroid isomerase-like protein